MTYDVFRNFHHGLKACERLDISQNQGQSINLFNKCQFIKKSAFDSDKYIRNNNGKGFTSSHGEIPDEYF